MNILSKYWFFFGMTAIIFAALGLPEIGIKMREYKVLNIAIFITFFITGIDMETENIFKGLKNFISLPLSLISSFVIFPGLAFCLSLIFFKGNSDFIAGICLLSTAPVTVASGMVLTLIAGGNVSLCILICVITNLASVFTIPISMDILMGIKQSINLPIWDMIQSLVSIVLLPIIIGQVIRPFAKGHTAKYKKIFSLFSQFVVLLIIFNTVSGSTSKILESKYAMIFIFIFMIPLHFIILVINFGLSKLFGLDRKSVIAFTIHTSQKTLTVPYIVWAGYFAKEFPAAMIPAIIYHLTQIIADTFIANRLAVKKEG